MRISLCNIASLISCRRVLAPGRTHGWAVDGGPDRREAIVSGPVPRAKVRTVAQVDGQAGALRWVLP